MAVSVTHAFVSAVPDGDDASVVRPSNWNAAHTITGLGTAAEANVGDFATAAQGALADTAVQPAAIGNMLETSDIGVSVQAYDPDLTALAAAGNSGVLAATTASFTTADETKLDGIAAGATANSPDATLLARANHTGTQIAATISDFSTAADARVSAAVGVTVQAYSAALASWAGVTRAAGFDTFAATPSSANLASLLSDETGTGPAVFANGPIFQTAASVQLDNDGAAIVPTFTFRKGRAGPAAVQSGDGLGGALWAPYDGTNYGTPNCAAFFAYATQNHTTSAHGSRISFETTPNGSTSRSERMRIDQGGAIHFPGVGTTASSANAYLDNGASPANSLLRSTSSLAYKFDVEPLDSAIADKLLAEGQAIWYRSLAPADKFENGREKSFYSFGAEPLAEIDPRLVSWGYRADAWEEIVVETGEGDKHTERRLKPNAQKVPDGVNDRAIIAMLFDIVKRQEARITALEAGAA